MKLSAHFYTNIRFYDTQQIYSHYMLNYHMYSIKDLINCRIQTPIAFKHSAALMNEIKCAFAQILDFMILSKFIVITC
jgi:hypothetical protein